MTSGRLADYTVAVIGRGFVPTRAPPGRGRRAAAPGPV